MKSATTIADAANITKADIFDLEAAYIESVNLTPRDNRQGYFHPSAVGMCGRRNVYEYIRAPYIPTIDADDLEVFDMGHAVHDIVQGKLGHGLERALDPKKIQFEFQKEVPFDRATDTLFVDFGIGGTCDGIMRLWVPGEWEQRGIVEVKSIKDQNYQKLSGPKEDHVMQAHLYAYRFDCPVIWIWYYNKNTSKRRVYPVVYDRDILMGALKRYEEWLKHIDAGTLPDREESWWMCPRCEYRDVCKPSIIGKQKSRNHAQKVSRGRKKGRLNRLPVITVEDS